MSNEKDFADRLQRVNDAVALKEPDRLPIIPMPGVLPYFIDKEGVTNREHWYNHEEAAKAQLRYHREFKPDIAMFQFLSGKANDIAGTTVLEWPGRPGTKLSDFSSHQVLERELMTADEYPELLSDFTGFMLRKYLPRVFPGLSGLASIGFDPSCMLTTSNIRALYTPPALDAFDRLRQIGEEEAKMTAVSNRLSGTLAELGFPPYITGGGEVPFDIVSDYFRGTMAMFEDQLERPEMVEIACDMLADIQISNFEYFKNTPLPVKRVFFPMHKGMDGFISPNQYETLYWNPFEKILKALIGMGVTPILYTEGFYLSRLQVLKEHLQKLPAGSCILHFEHGDFKQLKEMFEGTVCLSGGMPINMLYSAGREDVINQVKFLIDHVAPGGGYLFNTSGSVDNARRENIEAMFETAPQLRKKVTGRHQNIRVIQTSKGEHYESEK